MVSASVGDRPFPRGALLGAAALVGFALLSATTARLTGVGTTQMPAVAATESRELRFEDRADGSVAVYEEPEDRLVDVLAPGTNGFVRGALRAMSRPRRQSDVGHEVPFRLAAWRDGRMTLEDLATGRTIELNAFGETNKDVFLRLLLTEGFK